MQVKTVNDTWFKLRPVDSSALGDSERVLVPARSEFDLAEYAIEGNHARLTITGADSLPADTWYAYRPDIQIEEAHAGRPETDPITNLARNKSDRGAQIRVAGVGLVYLNDAVSDRAPNFRWYELTKNGTRLGHHDRVGPGMIRIAEAMQPMRDRIARPCMITSGYRDPASNKACRGAKASRHLEGDALDFWFPGMSKWDMWKLFNPTWPGGLGIYDGLNILHADARGYRVRWGA